MEDYLKLTKYLERFSKKTGVGYTLNLFPLEEDNSEAFKEIKKYFEESNNPKDIIDNG